MLWGGGGTKEPVPSFSVPSATPSRPVPAVKTMDALVDGHPVSGHIGPAVAWEARFARLHHRRATRLRRGGYARTGRNGRRPIQPSSAVHSTTPVQRAAGCSAPHCDATTATARSPVSARATAARVLDSGY